MTIDIIREFKKGRQGKMYEELRAIAIDFMAKHHIFTSGIDYSLHVLADTINDEIFERSWANPNSKIAMLWKKELCKFLKIKYEPKITLYTHAHDTVVLGIWVKSQTDDLGNITSNVSTLKKLSKKQELN